MNQNFTVQIVYVGADGSEKDGPLIQIPPPKRRRARRFNDDQWIESKAIARFKRYLFRQDAEGLTAAIRALDRLDCWSQAIRQLNLNRPTEKHAQILVSFWIERGLCSIPRGLRDNMPLLIDAFKRFVKPYQGPSVTLYRGELEARYAEGKCGIAWTADLTTAEKFADRRLSLQEGQAWS